jgi:protein-disulfide isomerase
MEAGRGSGRTEEVSKGSSARSGGGSAPRRGTVRKSNQKQNGRFLMLLALVLVVGGGALAYAYQNAKKNAPGPTTVDPSLPPLAARGYVAGDTSAPLQVLEFGDFECPQCANFAIVTEPDVRSRLIATGQISLRYFDFPLPMHPNTWPASHAAACADEQGKFWPMHDQLYSHQEEWNGMATSNPKKMFMAYATGLALDVNRFEQCFDSKKYQRQIEANRAEAERRQVNSTPTFIIGKRMIPGNLPYDAFKANVDSALAEARGTAKAATAAPATAAPMAAAKGGAGKR